VGELGLRRDGERIWIWIDGEPEGGTGERNGRAIDTLLLLLAAALSVVTPSDSG